MSFLPVFFIISSRGRQNKWEKSRPLSSPSRTRVWSSLMQPIRLAIKVHFLTLHVMLHIDTQILHILNPNNSIFAFVIFWDHVYESVSQTSHGFSSLIANIMPPSLCQTCSCLYSLTGSTSAHIDIYLTLTKNDSAWFKFYCHTFLP